MKPTFVYSGTFDPPTLGHVNLLQKAFTVFPEMIVVCSDHSGLPTKFSLTERVLLWQSYPLPAGITVETFDDFLKRGIPGEHIVLIRGLRNKQDGEHEAAVLLDSAKNAGISKTFTLVADMSTAHISSSLIWEAALQNNLTLLQTLASPEVIRAVQKKIPSLR